MATTQHISGDAFDAFTPLDPDTTTEDPRVSSLIDDEIERVAEMQHRMGNPGILHVEVLEAQPDHHPHERIREIVRRETHVYRVTQDLSAQCRTVVDVMTALGWQRVLSHRSHDQDADAETAQRVRDTALSRAAQVMVTLSRMSPSRLDAPPTSKRSGCWR